MTMQALAVVEGMIELDRLARRADVLGVDVVKAAELRLEASGVKRVIRVAGITSLVMRHAVVLEMCRRNVGLIVDVQTFSVRFHDVAGKAEPGLLGPLNMVLKSQQA